MAGNNRTRIHGGLGLGAALLAMATPAGAAGNPTQNVLPPEMQSHLPSPVR